MSLQIDMSEMPPGVAEEFRKGRVAKEVATLVKQPRLQDMLAREFQTDNRSIEGLGRLRMTVSADAFHYWGRRLGYGCWKDKQFLREFERDNPNVRVKCGGTRVQVGFTGGTKRFSKVYADKPVGGTPAAR
jgi:hypothetical protein